MGVLVAFWMSFVTVLIRDFAGLGEVEAALLDASFRIWVMLGVAAINLKAWWPWTSWYKDIDGLDDRAGEVDIQLRDRTGDFKVCEATSELVKEMFPKLAK